MGVITFHDNFRLRIGSLLEGSFSDAILLVEGVEIPVHKCILAVQSEYFRDLFSSENDEDHRGAASGSQSTVEAGEILHSNHQSLVEITDVTIQLPDNVFELSDTKVEVVMGVLEYFYRGEYNFHNNVETHFLALKLALQFKLRDLEKILIENLVKKITVENFVDFYNIKMLYKNVQLEESCSIFLKEKGEEIAKNDNFSKLTRDALLSLLDADSFAAAEVDIFRAAERWAGVNKPDKKTMKDIVDKIRMATMSQEDLFDVVRQSKDLPSIDILEPIQSITKKDAASTNFREQPLVADLSVLNISLGPMQGIPIASTNVALASRGTTVTGCFGTFCDPMNCINGKEDSSAGVFEDSPLTIKLGRPYWLSSLRVRINTGGSSYTIERSSDGESWQIVGGETSGLVMSPVWRTFQFSRRVVMYFRIKKSDTDNNWVHLHHFESPASTVPVTN